MAWKNSSPMGFPEVTRPEFLSKFRGKRGREREREEESQAVRFIAPKWIHLHPKLPLCGFHLNFSEQDQRAWRIISAKFVIQIRLKMESHAVLKDLITKSQLYSHQSYQRI